MKILIIHTVSSAKVLLITPLIRALKAWREGEIHVLSTKESLDLLRSNKLVNDFIDSGTNFFPLRRKIARESFDLIIDLDNSLISTALRIGSAKKYLVFKNRRMAKWLFIKTKIDRLPKSHVADQYLKLAETLGISDDGLGLDFFIPDKDEVENDWLPETHQNGYAALAISASHHTKKLPSNRLIELCDRINKPIILVGTSDDLEVANEVENFFRPGSSAEEEEIEELNKKTVIFNSCGKFSFNQAASLIKNASWVFTYDNPMMHIASVFDKRIYTMWGSTTPLMGTYPYRTKFTVFENNKLNCRPCSLSGYANCPKGHFKCMNDMTFDFYLPD